MKTQRTKIEKAVMLTMMFYFLSTVESYAANVSAFDTFYSTYVRPMLIALVVLVFVVVGLMNITEFRKGGDSQKEAFIHCVMMAVYPAAVLALAEAVKAIMKLFTSSLS